MKGQKRFDSAQKLAIIQAHLIGKKPISELCVKQGIAPSQVYAWQKELFERGSMVFEGKQTARVVQSIQEKAESRINVLRNKLAKKDEVISELMEEHVALKKSFGET